MYIYITISYCILYIIYGNQPVNQANKVLVKFSQGFTWKRSGNLGIHKAKTSKMVGNCFCWAPKCWEFWWENSGNASKYGGKSIANLTLCFDKALKLAVIIDSRSRRKGFTHISIAGKE